MTCEAVQERLSAYLDGELSPEAAGPIAEHLASCGACSAELESLKRLGGAIEGLAGMGVPAGFARRVRLAAATISAQPPAGGRQTLSRVAAGLVALAGLWLGLAMGSAAGPANGNGSTSAAPEGLDWQVEALSAAPAGSVAHVVLTMVGSTGEEGL